jgi:glycine/D-amino acid oxidase-like deaminating enzyme
MRRRVFVSAGLIGLAAKGDTPLTGGFVNDGSSWGHPIRDRSRAPAPKENRRTSIAIIGGGIAGLSAARRLDQLGCRDWLLLEAEPEAGGNARSGRNPISEYPWAAHYVPVPNRESTHVRELFTELGLILPDGSYDERWLCHSPQERLYLHGRWQMSLDPEVAGSPEDRRQKQRFDAQMADFAATGGFTLPMELGAKPGPLWNLSFGDWLARNGYDSPYLRWSADYGCRDDYGGAAADISAWAGVHYFASRQHDEKGPFTWPAGNGWIVARLLEKLGQHRIRLSAPVTSIRREKAGWMIHSAAITLRAKAVIFAAPSFLSPYVIEGYQPRESLVYSPWLTANLTIQRAPDLGETAWDNVIYRSPSLGYVVATHQNLGTHQESSVWTYYLALTGDALAQRRRLQTTGWKEWTEFILRDLEQAHPQIRRHVTRIDIMRHGHAMRRPVPGMRFPETVRAFAQSLLFANSDQSPLPVFEQAQANGIESAGQAVGFV